MRQFLVPMTDAWSHRVPGAPVSVTVTEIQRLDRGGQSRRTRTLAPDEWTEDDDGPILHARPVEGRARVDFEIPVEYALQVSSRSGDVPPHVCCRTVMAFKPVLIMPRARCIETCSIHGLPQEPAHA